MKFNIGDRVDEIEHCGLSKVVDIHIDEDGNTAYLVRQYAHPHKLVWADEFHLSKPGGRYHDDPYHLKQQG